MLFKYSANLKYKIVREATLINENKVARFN